MPSNRVMQCCWRSEGAVFLLCSSANCHGLSSVAAADVAARPLCDASCGCRCNVQLGESNERLMLRPLYDKYVINCRYSTICSYASLHVGNRPRCKTMHSYLGLCRTTLICRGLSADMIVGGHDAAKCVHVCLLHHVRSQLEWLSHRGGETVSLPSEGMLPGNDVSIHRS